MVTTALFSVMKVKRVVTCDMTCVTLFGLQYFVSDIY